MKKLAFCLLFALSLQTVQAQSSSTADEVKRFVTRAKTAYSMGKYQDALDEYRKAQQLVPNYPDLYKAIGEVYEKLGGDNDLKAAIESYNQYLQLSPDAADKDAMQEKIYSLGYIFEDKLKTTQILDDLSGYWVSNLFAVWNKGSKAYLTNIPYVILDIQEIQRTGKYRVTIRPECGGYTPGCGLYKSSIIEKTINTVPEKDNTFIFTFADAQAHNPSGATYNAFRSLLDLASSAAGAGIGSDIISKTGGFILDKRQENDLPSNYQTAYNFQLKYSREYDGGVLDGLYNIIQKYSDPQTSLKTRDNISDIYFTKQRVVLGCGVADISEDELRQSLEADGLSKDKIEKLDLTAGIYVTDIDKRPKAKNAGLKTAAFIFGGPLVGGIVAASVGNGGTSKGPFEGTYRDDKEMELIELSAAGVAGIEVGDRIAKINGVKVGSVAELDAQLGRNHLGDEITVTVVRSKKEKKFELTLRDLAPVRPRIYLGLDYQSINDRLMKEKKLDVRDGVYINSVVENGPAAIAGLKVGDIITGVNGVRVNNADDYLKQLLRYQLNDLILLRVFRVDHEENINVVASFVM